LDNAYQPVNELNELILMRKSRRQFIGWTFLAVSAACTGCREQKHTADKSGKTTQPRGTNSAVRWPDNVAGRFYVTQDCIDCDLCRDTAPTIFARNDKEGHSCVRKQPNSDSELRACLEAVEGCPVEAIIDTNK
jgi:ferredoxin